MAQVHFITDVRVCYPGHQPGKCPQNALGSLGAYMRYHLPLHLPQGPKLIHTTTQTCKENRFLNFIEGRFNLPNKLPPTGQKEKQNIFSPFQRLHLTHKFKLLLQMTAPGQLTLSFPSPPPASLQKGIWDADGGGAPACGPIAEGWALQSSRWFRFSLVSTGLPLSWPDVAPSIEFSEMWAWGAPEV